MSWHRNYAKICEKKSQNRINQGFSYYFCLMLEGSRSGSGSGSGSIPLTNGRIRIRIQEAQKHVDPGDLDPGDLDPDSDPDPGGPKTRGSGVIWIRIRIRNTAVMCILNFLGHKYSKVRNYQFFDIVITNLRVKTTLRNYA